MEQYIVRMIERSRDNVLHCEGSVEKKDSDFKMGFATFDELHAILAKLEEGRGASM